MLGLQWMLAEGYLGVGLRATYRFILLIQEVRQAVHLLYGWLTP